MFGFTLVVNGQVGKLNNKWMGLIYTFSLNGKSSLENTGPTPTDRHPWAW